MRSYVTLCSWDSPTYLAENTRLYLARSMSVKQSGWLQNLRTDSGMCVHWTTICYNTSCCDQWVEAAPHWHMGTHITKRHRQSIWSMEKAVMCKHEGKMTSLWTSAKLKSALFRANTLHNQLFSESAIVYQRKHVLRHFHYSYLKANKASKSEGTRKVECAYHFLKCADAVDQKLPKLTHVCWNCSLPKLAHFFETQCRTCIIVFVLHSCFVAYWIRSWVWEFASRQANADTLSPITTRSKSKDAWTAGTGRWPIC